MSRREVVGNILNQALEFGWLRCPLTNDQESSGLQHLKSCTGVWVRKTHPLLMVMREVDFKIWSYAQQFKWVRLPPC